MSERQTRKARIANKTIGAIEEIEQANWESQSAIPKKERVHLTLSEQKARVIKILHGLKDLPESPILTHAIIKWESKLARLGGAEE